jgi:hypothetical protein
MPANRASRTAVTNPPSSGEDRIIDMVVNGLKAIGLAVALVLGLWLGYDLFAPLYHLPLANPLNIAGALGSVAIVRRALR